MSFYSLAGLDLPSLKQLRNRLPTIQTKSANQRFVMCSICKKSRREELHIIVNYFDVQLGTEEVGLVCGRCRQEGKARPAIKLKNLSEALNAILQHQFCKEAIPILNKMIENVQNAKPSQRYCTESLVNHFLDKFLGTIKEQQQETEVETSRVRTCQLIQDFYAELRRSDIARLYHSLFNSQIRINSTLISFLRMFCKREKTFKLDVLQRMTSLASQTKDMKDLTKWMRKGVKGMQLFSTALAISPRKLKSTLYSVARRDVQFRYVYHQEQKQAECQLLTTEFPFTSRPNIFRVTSFGYGDEVDIGIFFARRNAGEQYEAACLPLLFRFQVHSKKEKAQTKINLSSECRHRLESKIILSEREQENKCAKKKQQIFTIEDEDELQLTVDYNKQFFRIHNRTSESIIHETSIKSGHTAKYFIFPCVRLVGTRIMLASLNE